VVRPYGVLPLPVALLGWLASLTEVRAPGPLLDWLDVLVLPDLPQAPASSVAISAAAAS
jgi:hypothetical protein